MFISVVQLFCNTITMFSIHTFLICVHVICLNIYAATLFWDRYLYVWDINNLDLTFISSGVNGRKANFHIQLEQFFHYTLCII